MMLPDVDADLSSYPVDGVVVDVAERPSSPSSRLFGQAGIAFFGSAHADKGVSPAPGGSAASTATAVAVASALEPSPLGVAPLTAAANERGRASLDGNGEPRALPFASPSALDGGSPRNALEASPVEFAAGGSGGTLAQRPRLTRLSGGMPRAGSHQHLQHLAKRAGSATGGGEPGSTEEERRKERVDAAATAAANAAQEHRHEKLAAARSMRAASASNDAEVRNQGFCGEWVTPCICVGMCA
jgi:hypothetical protein